VDLIDLPKCRYCGALATSNGPQGEPICAECPPMADADLAATQEEAAEAKSDPPADWAADCWQACQERREP